MPINDPYFDTDRCVARLIEAWHKYGQLIVAVDFDDTVFDWHRLDFAYPKVLALLRRCQQLKFPIAVFTASAKTRHPFMVAHLATQGLVPTSVNENVMPLPYGNDGKIFYNILLDDRAGLAQAYEILDRAVTFVEAEHSRRNPAAQ